MKKIILLCVLLFPCCAAGFEPQFEDGPVVGTIGASYTEAKSGDESPLLGGSLNNGGFFDINDALTVEGFTIRTEAQGGAFSYDLAGWRGVQTQVDKLLTNSNLWPDMVKVIDISLVNDCLHSVPCTEQDMDITMQNIYNAAETAHLAGKHVIVHAYPNWSSLHLAEAVAFYGIPYSISEADYYILKEKQKTKFENVPWVNFIYPWADAGVFPDGLHPGPGDMKKAGHIIGKKIKELLR